MTVGRAAAEPRAEERHGGSLEVADDRDEGEPGTDERGQPEQERRAAARPAAAKRAADERRRAESAAGGADETADRVAKPTGHETDHHGRDDRYPGCGNARRSAPVHATPIAVPSPARIPIVYQAPTPRGYTRAAPGQNVDRRPPTGATWMPNDARPLLVFFSSARSGPSRRMESLVAHIARKERERLRVIQVDVDQRGDLARKLSVRDAPALVLVVDRKAVARLDGRVSAPKIEAMLDEHVAVAA